MYVHVLASSSCVWLQDILNHVIEDLDNFIRVLKSKAAAWNELERKKKKSKRKKHDGGCGSSPVLHVHV